MSVTQLSPDELIEILRPFFMSRVDYAAFSMRIIEVTNDYTITTDDITLGGRLFVIVNATGTAVKTIDLPALSTMYESTYKATTEIVVQKFGSANVDIDGNGSETINGQLVYTITQQYNSVRFLAGASGWHTG